MPDGSVCHRDCDHERFDPSPAWKSTQPALGFSNDDHARGARSRQGGDKRALVRLKAGRKAAEILAK
jgi:hypothetical protein